MAENIIIIVIAGLFGLCFGSFANVVIYRVPKKLSVIKPRSACPACERTLGFFDLLPVFSWLFLRGKCKTCKAKIGIRYPLVELLCGLLFAGMAFYSPTLSVIPLSVFAFSLLTITYIDADTMEIPDGLVILGAVAGVLYVALGHFFPSTLPLAVTWYNALIGVAAGALPLLIIDRICLLLLKKDGFGYGDVKLMAMVGLFLGWRLILLAFFAAFLIGAVYAVYLMVSGKAKRGTYMPFGPFLCVGSLLALWFGEILFELHYNWLHHIEWGDFLI